MQDLYDLRTDFEVSKKQVEIDLVNQQKKTQQLTTIGTIIVSLLISILAFGLFRRYQFIKEVNKIIEEEKNKSDKLLLNILPEETANELKEKGKVVGKKFESVSVMFTDFKGFTSFSRTLSPEDLVSTINFYFSKFDEIIEKYQLEKIKTIGDAYMCAGGLADTSKGDAIKMVQAAIEIIDFVAAAKADNNPFHTFEIRIGINTGPVVAGIVGTTKFSYDIWGDTVNIAARMESYAESGKINLSENTYELIKEQFNCIDRGELTVKNRGNMKMYYINEVK